MTNHRLLQMSSSKDGRNCEDGRKAKPFILKRSFSSMKASVKLIALITTIIRITKSSFYHIFTVFESARFAFPYVLMMFRFQFS